jgi:hypothetical protein
MSEPIVCKRCLGRGFHQPDQDDVLYKETLQQNKQLKTKYINLLREILSQEPTDPEGIMRFQDFSRYDLDELSKEGESH